MVPFGGRSRSVEQIALRQRPSAARSSVRLVLQSRPDRPLICYRVDRVAKLRQTDVNESPGVRMLSDRNGDIDDAEWQAARQAAEREVAQRHQTIRNQPTQHRLRKPASRKPYLIANHPPEKLGRRYAWFSVGYLALLLACLFGIAYSSLIAAMVF